MIWVKFKIDQYNRLSIVAYGTKENIRPLLRDETAKQFNSIEEAESHTKKHNEYIRRSLYELTSGASPNVQPVVIQEFTHPLIIEKISESNKQIIKEFLENPTDLMFGLLMALHNKEGWSENVFCCGSQKKDLIKLFKTINLN